MFIDTHSHIYAEQFDADREQTIERAVERGVLRFILPAIDSSTHRSMFRVAESYPGHYPAMGVHPTSVKSDYQRELDEVMHYLEDRKEIVAVGEIGLDYYWDRTFEKEQNEVLRKQFDLAIKYNMPAIVHTRDAFEDMIKAVGEYKGSFLRILFHGFSGTVEEAETILSMGNHILGIGGVVTFKKSELSNVVKAVGLRNIVLETDAPYLAPVPFRGKRNESSYIPLIASHIASFMGVDAVEVEDRTTSNAINLFKLDNI